jgi:hypothetical protein
MNAISVGIASALAFAGAILLAYHENDGWGWLIFAGIVAAMAATCGDEK